MRPNEALKKYFGYDSFREGQEDLINDIIMGRDVLGIMPTGAGKSLCYQIPAVILDGVTIVISPLISLMQDQVDALNQVGIPSAFINSTLTTEEMVATLADAREGKYKLIYVAPERLLSWEFMSFARNILISMVTIDEAHCVSQWGQDFRPSYRTIEEFIGKLRIRPVVSAFTATATNKVQLDIVNFLALHQPKILVTGFNRDNLYFEVKRSIHKMEDLLHFIEKNKSKNGIIYCSTRKKVDEVTTSLNRRGYKVASYHAGMEDEDRQKSQADFLYDRVNIIVATNAFGMGIDKSNVSYVVHYNIPKDLESYYQEAGRAGRDGNKATCILYYSNQDVETIKWLIENSKDTMDIPYGLREELKEAEYARLQKMVNYATTNDCLRANMLDYFGETLTTACGNCSNCKQEFIELDITTEAQKILSCVYRVKGSYGAILIVDILRGSENKKIRQFGLEKLSTYGISNEKTSFLREIIDYLLEKGYLIKTKDKLSVLQLTAKSREILFDGKTLTMRVPEEKIEKHHKSKDVLSANCEDLFEVLKELRMEIAMEENVPAFVVFSDKTLLDMCEKMPQTFDDFLDVAGVGEVKRERYGEKFVSAINKYLEKK